MPPLHISYQEPVPQDTGISVAGLALARNSLFLALLNANDLPSTQASNALTA